MSHLEFLAGMDWKEESSRVVRRLVQTHAHLPQVWIYAARFELEKQVKAGSIQQNTWGQFYKTVCTISLI
jgi:predicted RNA methylase